MRPIDELQNAVKESAFFVAQNSSINRRCQEVGCENVNDKLRKHLKRYHTGEEKAVQSRCLENRFQMNGRRVRDIVNALRCEGYPICSGDDGYYYAASKKELLESIGQLNSRIEKISKAKDGLMTSLEIFSDSKESESFEVWVVQVKEE